MAKYPDYLLPFLAAVLHLVTAMPYLFEWSNLNQVALVDPKQLSILIKKSLLPLLRLRLTCHFQHVRDC